MKKNRTAKKRKGMAELDALSPESLSRVSGGVGGPGMFTGVLKKKNPEALQKYYDNLKDPIGLGDFIEGIANKNVKQALGGLAGVASSVIPGGRALNSVGTVVKAGLKAAKGAAKVYDATAKGK